jgi:hypothetical protein
MLLTAASVGKPNTNNEVEASARDALDLNGLRANLRVKLKNQISDLMLEGSNSS